MPFHGFGLCKGVWFLSKVSILSLVKDKIGIVSALPLYGSTLLKLYLGLKGTKEIKKSSLMVFDFLLLVSPQKILHGWIVKENTMHPIKIKIKVYLERTTLKLLFPTLS